ncbi:hypothetical protein Taro_055116 [Colocasia esculenta]|uniref:Uncharacterized protein n=1 Tax=Colocasia esculenta TaxID=4460 RepID=A0A843XQ71_COLES|nr:hypothetical protein [Colocasia esculenta]
MDINVVYLVCTTTPRFQPTCTILSAMQRMNNPQKTTELFSFGRPKEEKTRSHLHPLREAITPT